MNANLKVKMTGSCMHASGRYHWVPYTRKIGALTSNCVEKPARYTVALGTAVVLVSPKKTY